MICYRVDALTRGALLVGSLGFNEKGPVLFDEEAFRSCWGVPGILMGHARSLRYSGKMA